MYEFDVQSKADEQIAMYVNKTSDKKPSLKNSQSPNFWFGQNG